MVLGRPKKSPHKKPHGAVVPTELPVFSELERRGLVIVMGSEEKSGPGAKGPKKKPRGR